MTSNALLCIVLGLLISLLAIGIPAFALFLYGCLEDWKFAKWYRKVSREK
jgi:hypothetical protein